MTDETKRANVNVIAQPLASVDLTDKVFKCVKKAAKAKALRRGVKEVTKALRKNQKGLCVIAGDISPIDVICHVPIMCEEAEVPYIYVPSKHDLGAAGGTKRPTSVVLIVPPADWEYQKKFGKVLKAVGKVAPTF